MSIYTPDAWVIIKIIKPEETIYKVLAGWYGGFTGADSWKVNSGITSVTEIDGGYEFDGYSGSTYVCYKNLERLTGLTASMLSSFQEQSKEVEGVSIEVVPVSEVNFFLQK
jgi:hypothetical protein